MIYFGIIGLIIISYAIWLKNETKQNVLFVIGGVCLLIYSFLIDNLIFMILQAVFVLSAAIEIAKKSKSNS